MHVLSILAPGGRRIQYFEGDTMSTPLLQEQAAQENDVEVRVKRSLSTSLSAWWNAVLSGYGIVAYIPIVVAAILMFLAACWQMFEVSTDAARYQCYALTFWLGGKALKLLPASQCTFFPLATLQQPPFHILPLEYPPLAILPFSLGLLGPLAYYQVLFALWMALVAIFIYWLLLRYGPRGAGLTFALYILIGGWATAEGRFDLVPAALTLLCIIAAERKRWTWAYIALAFAVLLKIYPILLLPALFIAEQRAARRLYHPSESTALKAQLMALLITVCGARYLRWKNSLLFFAVLLTVTGAFALLDFHGAIANQLGYFANRPVQIEATGTALLWLGAQFEFVVHAEYSFGSLNVVGALDGVVSQLSSVALVLGYAYALWLQWRGKLDLVQAGIAVLLVFVATGKVFSPQYLIWIMPLLAYSNALDGFWLLCWGTISVLTSVIYPYLYTRATNILLAPIVPGFLETILARNALFVLVTICYLFNLFLARERRPVELSQAEDVQAADELNFSMSPEHPVPL
jgi:hypothetical protein